MHRERCPANTGAVWRNTFVLTHAAPGFPELTETKSCVVRLRFHVVHHFFLPCLVLHRFQHVLPSSFRSSRAQHTKIYCPFLFVAAMSCRAAFLRLILLLSVLRAEYLCHFPQIFSIHFIVSEVIAGTLRSTVHSVDQFSGK